MQYQDLNEGGALQARCLVCNRAFEEAPDPRRGRLKWFNAQAASELGYDIEGVEPPSEPEGCGKPNCSKGQCKNSGKKHPFK